MLRLVMTLGLAPTAAYMLAVAYMLAAGTPALDPGVSGRRWQQPPVVVGRPVSTLQPARHAPLVAVSITGGLQ